MSSDCRRAKEKNREASTKCNKEYGATKEPSSIGYALDEAAAGAVE